MRLPNSLMSSATTAQLGLTRVVRKLIEWLAAGLSAFMTTSASGYDNSRYPPFEAATEGRGFQNLSIHPNGQDWLISECSHAFTSYHACYLLIYNLVDRSYQRLDLPRTHSYVEAGFSPSGEQILFVRQPPTLQGGHSDVINSYAHGEIGIVNRDGSNFRMLPLKPSRIFSPVMSPNGEKLAYLVAGVDKPSGRGAFFTLFDIWEYDLTTGKNTIFAGPMKFYHASSISYLSNDEIIASGFAPANTGSEERRDYLGKYQGSEIFLIKRGMRFAPEPSFFDLPNAKLPSTDLQGNLFYETAPAKTGFSLTRKNRFGEPTIWREPRMNLCVITQYIAAPSGTYVGFIYGGDQIKTRERKHALGYFYLNSETWNTVIPPPVSESILMRLKTSH